MYDVLPQNQKYLQDAFGSPIHDRTEHPPRGMAMIGELVPILGGSRS